MRRCVTSSNVVKPFEVAVLDEYGRCAFKKFEKRYQAREQVKKYQTQAKYWMYQNAKHTCVIYKNGEVLESFPMGKGQILNNTAAQPIQASGDVVDFNISCDFYVSPEDVRYIESMKESIEDAVVAALSQFEAVGGPSAYMKRSN